LKIKVGFGFDIHRLEKGRTLYLGGVEIPHPAGLVGRSDGDALIHALVDALLGAAGEGDIGQMFPVDDSRYFGIRSTRLLEDVMQRLIKKGVRIINLDSVIVAEAPRMAPYINKMKAALCPILGVAEDDLGIKAKTHEKMGDIGRGRAIACWAVVLVQIKKSGKG